MKSLNGESCKYFEDYKLPILVLATKYPYKFKKTRKFISIAHQTAGHGCHQHYMMGTVLVPKRDVFKKMRLIDEEWLNSDCGIFSTSLDSILLYREHLDEYLNVDSNLSYMDFEEGIYPIDCTRENIKKLTDEKLPEDLDDLIQWKDISSWERFCGIVDRWNLFILGRNCD